MAKREPSASSARPPSTDMSAVGDMLADEEIAELDSSQLEEATLARLGPPPIPEASPPGCSERLDRSDSAWDAEADLFDFDGCRVGDVPVTAAERSADDEPTAVPTGSTDSTERQPTAVASASATRLTEEEATAVASASATRLTEEEATAVAPASATRLTEEEATAVASASATRLTEEEATAVASASGARSTEEEATAVAPVSATRLTEDEPTAVGSSLGGHSPDDEPTVAALAAETLASAPPVAQPVAAVYCIASRRVWWHLLDYREGMLLAQIDGARAVEQVIERSGLDPEQAVSLLDALERRGIIEKAWPTPGSAGGQDPDDGGCRQGDA